MGVFWRLVSGSNIITFQMHDLECHLSSVYKPHRHHLLNVDKSTCLDHLTGLV